MTTIGYLKAIVSADSSSLPGDLGKAGDLFEEFAGKITGKGGKGAILDAFGLGSFGKLFDTIKAGAGNMAVVGAGMVAAANGAKLFLAEGEKLPEMWQKVASGNLLGGLKSGFQEWAQSLNDSINALNGVTEAMDRQDDAASALANQIEYLKKLDLDIAADELAGSLRRANEALEAGSEAMARYNELAAQGASDDSLRAIEAELTRARNLRATREELEAASRQQEEFARRGRAIYEAVRSPLEQYAATVDDLNKLLQVGAISAETAARAAGAAAERLGQARGAQAAGSIPPLIEAGTQAYFRALAEQEARGMAQLDGRQEQQLAELRTASATLGQILQVLQGQREPPVYEVN